MNTLGKRLKERAELLELSDAEVARRVGISARRYSHYVTGRNEPNIPMLLKICRVLNSTPNELTGFDAVRQNSDERSDLQARLLAAANMLPINRLRMIVKQVEVVLDDH